MDWTKGFIEKVGSVERIKGNKRVVLSCIGRHSRSRYEHKRKQRVEMFDQVIGLQNGDCVPRQATFTGNDV